MTWILRGGLVLVLACLAMPAQAQLEPLALYDDFNARFLDPSKWNGAETGGGGGGGGLESLVELKGQRLHMAYRAVGRPEGGGVLLPRLEVRFPTPASITAMKLTVVVKQLQIDGCASDDQGPHTLRVDGTWFNTGVGGTPTAGSSLNDVIAMIRIGRSPSTGDPPGTLRVTTLIFRCDDAPCNASTTAPGQTLGMVQVGVPVMLTIQWDPANDQFVFTMDQNAPVNVSYATFLTGGGSDTTPPSFPNKRLRLAPNLCDETPQPTSFIDLLIDDVMVNQSAVP